MFKLLNFIFTFYFYFITKNESGFKIYFPESFKLLTFQDFIYNLFSERVFLLDFVKIFITFIEVMQNVIEYFR